MTGRGNALGDVATKKVKKFSWHQVPLYVTAVYRADKEDAALEQLMKLDDRALARQAEKVFGLSGIAKGRWDVALRFSEDPGCRPWPLGSYLHSRE